MAGAALSSRKKSMAPQACKESQISTASLYIDDNSTTHHDVEEVNGYTKAGERFEELPKRFQAIQNRRAPPRLRSTVLLFSKRVCSMELSSSTTFRVFLFLRYCCYLRRDRLYQLQISILVWFRNARRMPMFVKLDIRTSSFWFSEFCQVWCLRDRCAGCLPHAQLWRAIGECDGY
jgi:hypothetical protein